MGKTTRVLVIVPSLITTVWIDFIKPIERLKETHRNLDFKLIPAGKVKPEDFAQADKAIFCRLIEPSFLWLINECAQRKIPYIYQLDDNFFHIDPGTFIGSYIRQPFRIHALREFLRCASLVRVTSPNLLETVSAYNSNVKLYRTYFATGNAADQGNDPQNITQQIEGTIPYAEEMVRIVYSSSRHHGDSLQDQFSPALVKILKEYPGQVQLTFWGVKPNDEVLEQTLGFRYRPFVGDYDDFHRQFQEAQFTIGLAPMVDDYFHNSKTNNKYREYGGMGVAGIYSKTPIYTSCVRDMENGLLVGASADEWYQAVKKLIDDRVLLNRIRRQAAADVKANFNIDGYTAELQKDLDSLAPKSYSSTGLFWNKKILAKISTDFEAVAGTGEFYSQFRSFYKALHNGTLSSQKSEGVSYFIFSNNMPFIKNLMKRGNSNQYVIFTSDEFIADHLLGSLKSACVLLSDRFETRPGLIRVDLNKNNVTYIADNSFIRTNDFLVKHFGFSTQQAFTDTVIPLKYRNALALAFRPWLGMGYAFGRAWRANKYLFKKIFDRVLEACL